MCRRGGLGRLYYSGNEDSNSCGMAGLGGPAREFVAANESFGSYARWMDHYLLANGVAADDNERRRAVFLSAVGAKTFALLEDLVAPGLVSGRTYEQLVEVLRDHFEPKSSAIVARFRFNSCYRDDGESVTDYVARLRKLAKPCKFAEGALSDMLRDRLVCGIRDPSMQTKLLSESELTLDSALALACAREAAQAQAQEIGRAVPLPAQTAPDTGAAAPLSVGRVTPPRPPAARQRGYPAEMTSSGRRGGLSRPRGRSDPPQQQYPPCIRCRSRRHTPSRCWARSRRCYQCGEMGHVREACPLAGTGRPGRVGQVEEDDIPPPEPLETPAAGGDDTGETYRLLYQSTAPRKCHSPLFVDITLNGRAVSAELDTGAAVSVCSVEQLEKLFPEGGPPIRPSTRKLCTYGGDRLSLRGETIVCVQYRSNAVNLPLIVIEGTGPLLFGRDWLTHFQLDWAEILRGAGVSRVSDSGEPLVT